MDSKELFRRRISRATPEDQVFGAFIDGTVTSLGEEFKPGVMAAVQKARQRRKDWVLFSKYPCAEWLELMDVAASSAVQEEQLSYELALLRMGRGSVRHVLRTSTGRIFGTLVGKDPHRVLSTTVISAKVFATWGERSYEKLGERSARMRFHREFMGPAWVQGFYQEVFHSRTGLTSLALEVEDYEEPGMEFSIRYTW
jgi:uncharacterized protein (TIGR02265 family)